MAALASTITDFHEDPGGRCPVLMMTWRFCDCRVFLILILLAQEAFLVGVAGSNYWYSSQETLQGPSCLKRVFVALLERESPINAVGFALLLAFRHGGAPATPRTPSPEEHEISGALGGLFERF